MHPNKTFFLARVVALASAVIGTLIFAAYYYFPNPRLVGIGYFFIMVAVIASGCLLITCLLLIVKKEIRRKAILHAGILLLNVPLCLFLVVSFFNLINYERITLVNATGQSITELKSIGCAESRAIGKLEIGEQKEVWIPIMGDCSIGIEYRKNSEVYKETVIGYTTPNGGEKTIYLIGKPNPHNIH